MLLVLSRSAQYLQQLPGDWHGGAWTMLLLAVAVALLAQLLFGSAWHVLVGVAPGAWRRDLARWSMSLGGKYLPGKVFHGAMRIGAYRGDAAGSRIAAGFLRETGLSLGAACAWVALHAALSAPAPAPRTLAWSMFAASLALTLGAMLPLPPRTLAWLTRWHAPADAALAPAPIRRSAMAWTLQAAGYFAHGVALWLLARALAPAQAPGLFALIGAFCFAGVAGVAAFMVPAGIGVREAALAWYLAAWMPAGSAALLAIAARLCLSLAEAIAIAAGLLLMRAERR